MNHFHLLTDSQSKRVRRMRAQFRAQKSIKNFILIASTFIHIFEFGTMRRKFRKQFYTSIYDNLILD